MNKITKGFKAFEGGAFIVFNLLFLNVLILVLLQVAVSQQGGLIGDHAISTLAMITTLAMAAIVVALLSALGFAAFIRFGIRAPLQAAESESLRIAHGSAVPQHQWQNPISRSCDFNFQIAAALAQAVQRERAIADFALEAFWLLDKDLVFQAASPTTTRLWGYEPIELIDKPLVSMIVPEEIKTVANLLTTTPPEPRSQTIETRLQCKNGPPADIKMSVEWSAAESGYFCVVSDISARKQVERARQEIIGMLSHDLRAPLMNLQFSLALLAKEKYGALNERGLEMLTIGENNINRLVRMITELLDLQKLESGSLDMKRAGTKVSELCQTAIASLQESAHEKQIEIIVQVGDHLSVNVDTDRIVQVLVNLLANAINYSSKETEILLSASQLSKKWVEIKVKDSGPGIAEQDRQLIFDRFRRLSGKHTEEASGSGLGLAICKGLVEAHGGTIGVESMLGEGSTFWIRLPADLSATSTS